MFWYTVDYLIEFILINNGMQGYTAKLNNILRIIYNTLNWLLNNAEN
jgi:hypothetical protein